MGAPKALVRDPAGVPLLFRAVDALLGGGCQEVCVVVGAASDEVDSLLRSRGSERPSSVRMTRASDWSTGMGASLRAGLHDAYGGAQDVALISLVDLPDVTADVVRRVLGRLELGSDTLARATYQGRPGHPVAVITHDMSEALKIGDRIAILRQGSLVQVGAPEDILLRPADSYVSRFTEDTSRSRFVRAEAVVGRALVLPCATTVHEARQAIDKAGRDHVVTVDPAGRPQAAVSREELVNGRDGGRTLEQAASPARSIDSKRSLQEVAQLVANGPGPVTVITSDGRVLGVVETGLLVKALADFPTSLAEEDADVPRGQETVAAGTFPLD